MRSANVYINDRIAGFLSKNDSEEYIFRYDDSYFTDILSPPISLTLPKNQQEFKSKTLFPFFFNMLSEGYNKQVQLQLYKIDEKDHFGLLLATAKYDTIGAITVKETKSTKL